jgi:(2Fe-2S) ferredoxin
MKRVQLTISGCLGPCDVPNVALIVVGRETHWLGNLEGSDYQELIDWAVRCKQGNKAVDLLKSLRTHEIAPFISHLGCERS